MSLSLKGLCARVGETLLFDAITETIAGGEVLAVMGPSGVGKTTLLNVVAGFDQPGLLCDGRIELEGQDISALPAHKRRLGLVFQTALLFPHLSVGENLGFGIPAAVRGQARKTEIAEALAKAGLAGFEDRDPDSLSGGQKARVSLLRTLLSQPRALLLDEPFSALDSDTRAEVRAFTLAQIQTAKLPTLLVTHDPSDAEALGARTLRMTGVAE